ncbi:Myb-like_DNA-binding domain-containing protein [Hexamita inflata]|uniref:Myb-like DNA-binding domain-containing protein n=1 Tax=Hexamita inflata TaxID=28002 RepID=A0AA86PJJ6_9EUKA|nr:Myb-like DNA-binding domain-containing protein [Hexamita inflata]
MPTHWTDEEKQKLIQVVDQNKLNNRIQWKVVQNIMNNKSYNQCRTMYSVMLKPEEAENVNFRWSFKNYAMLLMCVLEYGTKWKFIQKNYFPNTTANAIKKKFIRSQNVLQKLIQILDKIRKQQNLLLSNQELYQLQIVIQYLIYRASLCNWYNMQIFDATIHKPIFPIELEIYKDDEMETAPIEIIEIKLYKRIQMKIDFDQIKRRLLQMQENM